MRRTFVILLAAAVAVWGYVVFQFLAAYFGKASQDRVAAHADPFPAEVLQARSRPGLDTAFRDPFQSYLYAQKPAPARPEGTGRPGRPALTVIEPPTVVLGGILWGDSPVAILKQDSLTELVKEGAVVWGLKIIRIERHQVTVVKQGRRFTLGY